MRLLRIQILVISSLITFILGAFIFYLLIINNNNDFFLTSSTITAFISSAGSLLGGLIGGFVAFVVARSQFLNDREQYKNKQNEVYLNLLRSLKNEINHNLEAIEVLDTNREAYYKYTNSLESEVWNKVKYDVNNFLPTELYKLLDDQNREYKDIKEALLPDYQNIDEIDFDVRLKVHKKIICDIEKEVEKYSEELKEKLL